MAHQGELAHVSGSGSGSRSPRIESCYVDCSCSSSVPASASHGAWGAWNTCVAWHGLMGSHGLYPTVCACPQARPAPARHCAFPPHQAVFLTDCAGHMADNQAGPALLPPGAQWGWQSELRSEPIYRLQYMLSPWFSLSVCVSDSAHIQVSVYIFF